MPMAAIMFFILHRFRLCGICRVWLFGKHPLPNWFCCQHDGDLRKHFRFRYVTNHSDKSDYSDYSDIPDSSDQSDHTDNSDHPAHHAIPEQLYLSCFHDINAIHLPNKGHGVVLSRASGGNHPPQWRRVHQWT